MSRRKISFYTPGIISLCLLLPLGMYMMDRYRSFEVLHALEVYFFEEPNPYAAHEHFVKNRNVVMLELTGVRHDNEVTIDFLELSIKKLLQSDSLNTIRVHFNDDIVYNEMVQSLALCSKYGASYVVIGDDLWIVAPVRKNPGLRNLPHLCGGVIFPRNIVEEEKSAAMIPFTYSFDSRLWPTWLLLGSLIVITFVQKFRRNLV